MKTSYNDQIITEVYKQGQGLKTEIRGGFAFVSQKTQLAGLRVLVDAKLNDGSFICKGSTIFVAEDELSTMAWAKTPKTAETLDTKEFIVVPLRNVVFVDDGDRI